MELHLRVDMNLFWGRYSTGDFHRDCTLLMILSAPLHPSLIDFGSKYFYLGQKVDLQFHNLLNEGFAGRVQNCCHQLVVLIELQEYLWNSPREHANSLRRGCRGAGLHRRGAGGGRGRLVGNSLQGADSNVKVAGFRRRPMATKWAKQQRFKVKVWVSPWDWHWLAGTGHQMPWKRVKKWKWLKVKEWTISKLHGF